MAGAVLEVVGEVVVGDASVTDVDPEFNVQSQSWYIQTVGISQGDGTEDIPGRDTVEVGDDNIGLGRVRSSGVQNTVKE